MTRDVASSVVVVFSLVPNGRNDDLMVPNDMKQRDVAGCTERDHQLSFESMVEGDAAGERISLQNAKLTLYGGQCASREIPNLHA